MIWKLVFIATLTVGAWGRSIDDREGDPVDQMAKLYCQATNAEDKTQQVKESLVTFSECIKGIFDMDALKAELEEAMRTKVFDQLFKKQCTKAPQLKSCFNALFTGMSPCLPASVRNDTGMATILDFVCENDGARMTSFFQNNGPQCMAQQQHALKACAVAMQENTTRVMGETGPAVSLKMTEEERCSLAEDAVDCLVAALKQCPNPTPGNLLEELSKKIPCRKETQPTEDKPVEATAAPSATTALKH